LYYISSEGSGVGGGLGGGLGFVGLGLLDSSVFINSNPLVAGVIIFYQLSKQLYICNYSFVLKANSEAL
jgi:hypothetical protein